MSLKIKRILTITLCSVLLACVAFGATAFIINKLKPVYAEGTENTITQREVVEWTTGSNTTLEFVDNGDGTGYTQGGLSNLVSTTTSAYTNILKKAIKIEKIEAYKGSYSGISVQTNYTTYPTGLTSDGYRWQTTPRVVFFKDCFIIANSWGRSDTHNPQKTVYNYKLNADTSNGNPYVDATGKVNIAPDNYVIYFGLENVYEDANAEDKVVKGFNIYAKLTSLDGSNVYVDYTFYVDTTTYMNVDCSGVYKNVCIATSQNLSSSASKDFRELADSKIYYIDELENDEDISFYWDKAKKDATDANEGLAPSNDILIDGCQTFAKGDYFYSPDFDNRITLKFKAEADADNTYWSTGRGEVRFSFGQRYSNPEFVLDYKNNTVELEFNNSTLANKTASKSFTLDVTKEYKVSMVIRDIRTADESLAYRLLVLDVAEFGNETNCVSLSLLAGDTREYGANINTTHFRIDDGTQAAGAGTGFTCKVSAIEPWYNLTVVDGDSTETTKIKSGEDAVTLTDGADENKIFVGWLYSGNENVIYKAGKAPLNGDETYTALYLDKFEMLDVTSMSLVNVKLKYKAEISASDWTLIDKHLDFGFDVVDGVTPLTVNEGVALEGDGADRILNVIFAVAEENYQTEYRARAFFTVTYANAEDSGVETIYADGQCRNSAAAIADYALKNPELFGAYNGVWGDKYVAEFNRIMGVVAE